MGGPKFTLYGRPDCHLCDEMLDALKRYLASQVHEVEIVDIDQDPALQLEYGGRIPVLCLGEQFLCEYFFDPKALDEIDQSSTNFQ